ncbi:hypothetical protein J7K86_02950 [bacterium]|nr:hypothetical protein [bacterium]
MFFNEITINLYPLLEMGGLPWFVIVWRLFIYGFWFIFLWAFAWGIWQIYLKRNREKFISSQPYVLLAINVPRDNQEGPESAERLFVHLAGARSRGRRKERMKGRIQIDFSFELVSDGGKIQYYVRTPAYFRDLVESAIYASYPDAEIKEVDDYTKKAPDKFPNEEYNLWGADIGLYNKNVYPIKTYHSFERSMTIKTGLTESTPMIKDSLADLLEILSKLKPGEQVWLQLIVKPTSQKWVEEGKKIVKKAMGKEVPVKQSMIEKIISFPVKLLESLGDLVFGRGYSSGKKEGKTIASFSPGERKVIEAIERKISKTGYEVKFRIIYLAKKEVFSKTRGVAGVLGALNEFNTLDMNGFKPIFKTTDEFIFFPKKNLFKLQNRILEYYKKRNRWAGGKTIILNVEELASIYHFPVSAVKAPLVTKAGSKRAEPPTELPTV